MLTAVLLGMILGIAFIPASALIISLPILMIAKWLAGARAVWFAGIAMICFIAYEIFDTLHTCGAAPVIISPECDTSHQCATAGRAVFACDGPDGALAYGLAYLGLPAAAVGVGLLTSFVARRSRRNSGTPA